MWLVFPGGRDGVESEISMERGDVLLLWMRHTGWLFLTLPVGQLPGSMLTVRTVDVRCLGQFPVPQPLH